MYANELKLGPATMLDQVISTMNLANDAALARALEVRPPIISKIRNNKAPVTSGMLIVLHEASGMSIRDLRFLGGDLRLHTGKSAGPAPVFHPVQCAPRKKTFG